jgi:predicted ArsR family transcriptional regulator
MRDDDALTVQLARVCSLGDRTRRRLYDWVVDQPLPVSRDTISNALDIERSLAAYHLDKLVDHGLLVATFARPSGRGGPGAGRPAKHYSRADTDLEVSVPSRDYRLVADLLAKAMQADGNGAVRGAVEAAAGEFGRELGGAGSSDLTAVLARQGYEPFRDGDVVRLRNCPFHRVARDHVELVCGMNLALLEGVLDALGDGDARALLDPGPDRCCVAITDAP